MRAIFNAAREGEKEPEKEFKANLLTEKVFLASSSSYCCCCFSLSLSLMYQKRTSNTIKKIHEAAKNIN
jgi:hypothetical protein